MSIETVEEALEWLDDLIEADAEQSVTERDAWSVHTILTNLQKQLVDHEQIVQQRDAVINLLQNRVQKLNNSRLLYMHLASALFKELLTNEAEQID